MLYGSVLDKTDAYKYLLEHNAGYQDVYKNLYVGQSQALNTLSQQENLQLQELNDNYTNALNKQYVDYVTSSDAIIAGNYGTGAKDALLERNRQALREAYAAYQQQYLADKYNIESEAFASASNVNQQYNDAWAAFNEGLSADVEYMSSMPEELYKYLQYLDKGGYLDENEAFNRFYSTDQYGDRSLLSWENLTSGLGPEKYYDSGGQRFQYEAMIDNDGNLTDYGRDIFNQLLAYGTIKDDEALSFGSYLFTENKDLANWLYATDQSGKNNYEKFLEYGGLLPNDLSNPYDINSYQRQLYTGDLGKFDTRTTASAFGSNIYSTTVKDGGTFKITSDNNTMFSYFDDDGLHADFEDFEGYDLKIVGNKNGWTPDEWYKNGKATKLIDDELAEGQAGWEHNRRKTFVDVAKKAQAGELPNYTIIDVNRGSGTNYYIYLNGKFYNVHLRKNGKGNR